MRRSSKKNKHDSEIPRREDINPTPGNLDEESAVKDLLGKSLAELTVEFTTDEQAAFQMQEHFMFMGPKAFQYYFPAYLAYFESDLSNGYSDTVNCVIGFLRFRLETEPETLHTIRPIVLATVRCCLAKYDKFHINTLIYGDLKQQLCSLEQKMLE